MPIETVWSYAKPGLEIIVLWIVVYQTLIFFEGTRAFHVMRGLSYLALAFLATRVLGLENINWILTKIFGISVIAVIVIFQNELRQGLARLGQHRLFSGSSQEKEAMGVIEHIADAACKMSRKRMGGLIAIEKEVGLKPYIESGQEMDALVSSELIQTIFATQTPLHDGGLILRGNRIVAASCLFPLSEKSDLKKSMGTRHRAALGLSEQTDAVVVVVSEETSDITIAYDGAFTEIESKDHLMEELRNFLIPGRNAEEAEEEDRENSDA